jgi:PilZ domain
MFTPRRAPRHQIALPASIERASESSADGRLLARTLDLSEYGVGLIVPGGIERGEQLWVAVEERYGGHRQLRRWRGTVANTQPADDGLRVGIVFDAPDRGPVVVLSVARASGRESRYRLDPPWAETATRSEPREQVEPRFSALDPEARLAQRVAVIGFLADQWSRALVFSPSLLAVARTGDSGVLGQFFGGEPLGNAIAGLAGVGLAGVVARKVFQPRAGRGRILSCLGGGLMVAGLLANASDRLALGYARPIFGDLAGVTWIASVADVSLLSGALICLGGWSVGRFDLARRRLAWRAPMAVTASLDSTELLDRSGAGGSIISTL